jgi:hypothetical protein
MGKSDQKADEKTQAAIQRTRKSDAPPTTQTVAASGSQPTAPSPTAEEAAAPPATTTDDYHPSQTVRKVEGSLEQKLELQPGDSSADAAAKEHAKALSSRIPRRPKERATVAADRTKQFFNEEFPKDRRDQFIWRMKKVHLKSNYNRDYPSAVPNARSTYLFRLLPSASLNPRTKARSPGSSTQSRHISILPSLPVRIKGVPPKACSAMTLSCNKHGRNSASSSSALPAAAP